MAPVLDDIPQSVQTAIGIAGHVYSSKVKLLIALMTDLRAIGLALLLIILVLRTSHSKLLQGHKRKSTSLELLLLGTSPLGKAP